MSEVRIECRGSGVIDIEEIKPFQGKLKELSTENYEKLKKEILTNGFSAPFFLWEKTNECLDGHQRLSTLLRMRRERMKIPELPYVHIVASSRKQAKQKLLAFASQYGKMTSDGLYEFIHDAGIEFSEVTESFHFPEISFDKFEKEFFDKTETVKGQDEVPEKRKTSIKRGDLFVLGHHRLLCGDSTDAQDLSKLMDGKRADFCFTSPPYGDHRDYSGDLVLDPNHLAKFLSAPCDLFAVNLGIQRRENEIYPYWNSYIDFAKNLGLKLLSWNIWDRSGLAYTVGQATAMFTIDHEWILVFGGKRTELKRTVKNKHAGNFQHGTNRQKDGSLTPFAAHQVTHHFRQLGTVVRVDVERDQSIDHPAKFPVALPEKYIEAIPSKIIFEPFCGSGTTLIACEKLNRQCYGMEIDPQYCQVIIDRWEKFSGGKATRINEKEIEKSEVKLRKKKA